jgi:hypothetical protein
MHALGEEIIKYIHYCRQHLLYNLGLAGAYFLETYAILCRIVALEGWQAGSK